MNKGQRDDSFTEIEALNVFSSFNGTVINKTSIILFNE